LCGHIGVVMATVPLYFQEIAADLERLQPLAYHLHNSSRGSQAIEEPNFQWLLDRYRH